MAFPGKNAKVYVGGTSGNHIMDVNNATFTVNREIVDITAFKESANGFRDRLTNLGDAGGSMSGFYNPTDTNGQVVLRASALTGSEVSGLTVLAASSAGTGFKCNAFVESFEKTSAVEGAVGFTMSFQSNGVVEAV